MEIKNKLLLGALALSLSATAQKGPYGSSEVILNVQEAEELRFLNDFEDVFSAEEEQKLEAILADFERATDDRIVIITTDSIADFSDFDQYSLHLIDELEVGREMEGSGIVLVFSSNLRKIHLNTEFENDKKVSDATYERVVKEVIIPEFKQGNHYAGIRQGLEKIIAAWEE